MSPNPATTEPSSLWPIRVKSGSNGRSSSNRTPSWPTINTRAPLSWGATKTARFVASPLPGRIKQSISSISLSCESLSEWLFDTTPVFSQFTCSMVPDICCSVISMVVGGILNFLDWFRVCSAWVNKHCETSRHTTNHQVSSDRWAHFCQNRTSMTNRLYSQKTISSFRSRDVEAAN